MKVVIAASHTVSDLRLLDRAVAESGFDVTEVLVSTARGPDRLGQRWAERHRRPCTMILAGFVGRGSSATTRLLDRAEAVVAVRRGGDGSALTTRLVTLARERGLPVHLLDLS